jgi:hypothetical protein
VKRKELKRRCGDSVCRGEARENAIKDRQRLVEKVEAGLWKKTR